LAEDIVSRHDIPPFLNSSMDGYAVRAADVTVAGRDRPVRLPVVMDIPAGQSPARPLNVGEAARIMTGAPLPDGADAVIPVEDTDDRWTPDGAASPPAAVRVYRSVQPGDFTRAPGEDIRAGQIVLRAGAALRPQDIGVLVSLGQVRVPVVRQPRVAILSTGDELVDIDEELGPGQIRNSNSYMLAGLVTSHGGIAIRLGVARDTLDDVRRRFRDALDRQPDLIVSSAGVSVGARDVVRTVIDELGRVDLWRVNLRPGKPLAYGQVGGVPFFGLPGNPVSVMVTFELFVRPALLRMAGKNPEAVAMTTALTGEAMRSDGRRSYLRVRLVRQGDDWIAYSTGTQSSGALISMVLADGLLIVPEGTLDVPPGTRLRVWLLRDLA
jgi:molybdopterin molybdotransferase